MTKVRPPKETAANDLVTIDGEKVSRRAVEVIQRQTIRTVQMEYSGPLPPPTALAEYGKHDPRIVEHILATADREQLHRHRVEMDAVQVGANVEKWRAESVTRGQWFGFGVSIGVLVVCGILAMTGAPGYAVGLGSATLVGLAAAYITSTIVEHRAQDDQPPADADSE